MATFGRLDIVVASAAVQLHDRDHTLHEMDEAVWDRTHDINYRGVFVTCKYAIAQMMKQGEGGALVIISSVAATSGRSANLSYISGKHGLLWSQSPYRSPLWHPWHTLQLSGPGALERTPNHDIHPDPEGRAATFPADDSAGSVGHSRGHRALDHLSLFRRCALMPPVLFFLVDGGMSA